MQQILLLILILCEASGPALSTIRGILKVVQNVSSCSSAGLTAAKTGPAQQF